jgi:hypothetical protein
MYMGPRLHCVTKGQESFNVKKWNRVIHVVKTLNSLP